MSDQLQSYAIAIDASSEVIEWLKNILKARERRKIGTDQNEMEHILDYLVSDVAPKRLRKMSYDQARVSANKWREAQKKKGRNLVDKEDDIEPVHDFLDGTKIVKLLSKSSYYREGYFMSHCVGGYNPESSTIYSYRDKKNEPHATFEVSKNGDQIMQIKGKGNGPIHPKYINPILTFLKVIGLEVRPSEMRNLGYLHLSDELETIVKSFVYIDGQKEKIVSLYGERYLCVGV